MTGGWQCFRVAQRRPRRSGEGDVQVRFQGFDLVGSHGFRARLGLGHALWYGFEMVRLLWEYEITIRGRKALE